MKLKIQKFKTIQDRELSIPAEISGGNGTGKTTILEAISFCLTGKDLNGATMEQIYDNRQDLHEALADVSFFDGYGNEYRRKVQPTFETSRDGEERLKILRSTKCTKNGIDCNDFANEFQDFYNFGTDYFFNQKEADQRAMFIDLMKSLLPSFDVKEASERLKQLQKSQRNTVADIKAIRAMLKELRDEEIKEVSEDLQKLESEYQSLVSSSSDNQALTAEINRENNALISSHRAKVNELENALSDKLRKIKDYKIDIERAETELLELGKSIFLACGILDLSDWKNKAKSLQEKLNGLDYFDNVQEFGKKYALKNPIVAQNITRIKALQAGECDGEELSGVCSACGVESPQALEKALNIKTGAIKQANRDLLTIDMRESNNAYLAVKDELERVSNQLDRLERENVESEKNNAANKRKFDIEKTNKTEVLIKQIKSLKTSIELLTKDVEVLNMELGEVKEPKLKNLPTELAISEELKNAHVQYLSLRDEIIGAKAVNENNKRTKVRKETEIKEKQELLANLDSEVVDLQAEISNYFSNLSDIVAKEFDGKIKIGVQLLEYVITKNEYKDCFKIMANDKVFPSECNGALINNVKLQVLRTLQRLKNYKGITIIDNVEASTTQPLDGDGLNLVAAKATNESELIIK